MLKEVKNEINISFNVGYSYNRGVENKTQNPEAIKNEALI